MANDSSEWTSDDIANWRAFLKTKTGSRLLPKLSDTVPALLAGGPTNEILIRSGESRGWAQCIGELFAMSREQPPEPKSETTNYPDLLNDDEWSDGKKLNP